MASILVEVSSKILLVPRWLNNAFFDKDSSTITCFCEAAAGWLVDEAATAMVELADNQVLMIMANEDTDAEIARALKRR